VTFHDHFSRDSSSYAKYRPRYPAPLFDWLAAQTTSCRLAWDCATGNGQAAIGLAERFEQVVATDASADQLREAIAHPRIDYRLAAADASGLASGSVDLVTSAQALHWLPRAAFYAEARRVLRPHGVIAVWGYHIATVGHAALDAAIRHFHDEVVGPFWPPQRKLVLNSFRELEFPFEELTPPAFEMRCDWSLRDFMRYVGTQSAVGRYQQSRRSDPVPAFADELAAHWGPRDAVRSVQFPLFLRVGRV
jgi:SAM-dependent methyltransferase